MANDVRVKVEGVSKKFCRNLRRSLWYGVTDLASELLAMRNGRAALRKDEFWALKDISFEVYRGETLGIIGHNGAGKSTLLKIVNGLIRPDAGAVHIYGQVGALIELGMGFSPILTGRENVYVNAAILGLPRREVERRLDDIIAFAEIGDFIDAPLQTYSSGMKVRLGFSIAANLTPDILLIDEVLSVGDVSFRERCHHRLLEFKRNGGTIFFVSHNASAVEAVCDRVLLLDHGQVVEIGNPADVLARYEKKALAMGRASMERLFGAQAAAGGDDVTISAVRCYDLAGEEKTAFEFEEPFEIRVEFVADSALRHPFFYIGLQKGWDAAPFCAATMDPGDLEFSSLPARCTLGCVIKAPRLSPGEYQIVVAVNKYLSAALGQKHYAAPRLLGELEIKRDRFVEVWREVRSLRFQNMAPVVLDYDWHLSEATSGAVYRRIEEEGQGAHVPGSAGDE